MTADTLLSREDRELFRDTFRKFLKNEVEPYYAQWEKEEIFPRELWHKLGQNGFLAVDVPEEYGGYGADFALSAIIIDEFARNNYMALASSVSVHSDIVTPYILHLGSEEQKQQWLPKMVSGEAVGAIAMTEPGAGSDLQGMRTSAVLKDGQYSINGQKTFITNGQHCDVIVVAAKTDPNAGAKGITLFTVDATLPGFERGRNLEKMGLHCGDTSELFFDNVTVPEAEILGGLGKGFANLMNELPRERLILAISAIMACEGMIESTVEYVNERKAFGMAVSQFQNTRFKLADLKTQVEVNKAYIQQCIGKYEQNALSAVEASMAKLSTTELQSKVADECLQLFGGYGYMMEYGISRAYMDARIQRIYGGTSEIMKEIIARSLVGK
ncbi:acyl-CoA dehydrogenase family protein [Ketobacter sp.]|uniref:acyl-CoA dehydrogenase family protein n=1 Tax=Ketobacter sp. TaxID=2083498 RepID=UPI0026790A75|nr:acyl-CoA dehydrogenase family protein [Ketobacter sp.]